MKIQQREDHIQAERKRAQMEQYVQMRTQAQTRWSILVVLASKREFIAQQLEIMRNLYETQKKRWRAAITIQKAWAAHREKLYQAGKLEKIRPKTIRLPLDVAIL